MIRQVMNTTVRFVELSGATSVVHVEDVPIRARPGDNQLNGDGENAQNTQHDLASQQHGSRSCNQLVGPRFQYNTGGWRRF